MMYLKGLVLEEFGGGMPFRVGLAERRRELFGG